MTSYKENTASQFPTPLHQAFVDGIDTNAPSQVGSSMSFSLACYVSDRTVSVQRLVGFGEVVGSVCWESTLGYNSAVSHQNVTTLCFDIVPTMWPNVCNSTIPYNNYIP